MACDVAIHSSRSALPGAYVREGRTVNDGRRDGGNERRRHIISPRQLFSTYISTSACFYVFVA